MFTGKCYHCHQVWHTMSQCPKKTSSSHMGDKRTQLVQQEDCQSITSTISKAGPVLERENLMLRRTLLKIPQSKDPTQRKTLFKTTFRYHGKICKVIGDSSSTKNIIAV